MTVNADSTSIGNVIGHISAAGCIDSSGVSNALINKLTAAQTAISAGDIRTAINTLNGLLQQLSAQGGKHISTSCTAGGTNFNPVDVLTKEVKALMATLKASPDPLVGYVVSSTGVAIHSATVSIFDSTNQIVGSAITDVTGFRFFATTNVVLVSGSTYSARVTGFPAGYTKSTSQTFTRQGTVTTLPNLVLQ